MMGGPPPARTGKKAGETQPLIDDSERPWYELLAEADGTEEASGLDAGLALRTEVERYEAFRKKKETGDDKYMQQVLKSGTLSDKVAAMTLLVQESPVHRGAILEELLDFARGGKRSSKMAIESLKDLFSKTLLPSTRRLACVKDKRGSEKVLALLAFEEFLKTTYGQFVETLEATSTKNAAPELRAFAVETAATLLEEKPELEQRILAVIVNKLGDPEGSVSSKASAALTGLLKRHRAMTKIVANEVQALAARPNVDTKALYNAIAFLSQIYLDKEHLADVAASLCEMYVAFFKRAVEQNNNQNHKKTTSSNSTKKKKKKPPPQNPKKKKKKNGGDDGGGGVKANFLALLLTGLRRALPYCGGGGGGGGGDSSSGGNKIGTSSFFETAKAASSLDSLFLVSHQGTFKTRIQALALLDRLSSSSSSSSSTGGSKEEDPGRLRRRFDRALYEVLVAPELRQTTKPTLVFNLCYVALSSTKDDPLRSAALLKRVLHVAAHAPAASAAASVYLAARLRKRNKPLEERLETGAPTHDDKEDDDRTAAASTSRYVKRDPLYATSVDPKPWEVATFLRHYHPSVRAFARQYLEKDRRLDAYAGDPLQDFTLSNFFDRFAYRNPKKHVSDAGLHSKRPVLAGDVFDSYDFYATYLREAESHKLRQRLKRHEDDDDEADDDDGLLGDDDDEHFDDDAFDDDDDDDDVEEDDDSDDDDDVAKDDSDDEEDDFEGPTSAVRDSGKKRKKSPFVDAEEYMDQLASKKQKVSKKKTKQR